MTKFRPCIDIHEGKVKQIVGGTLDTHKLAINFESEHSAAWYAKLYQQDQANGGHVIQLGPGNHKAALDALQTWPQGLQVGGGINLENASSWLESGASHVIVTSYLFDDAGIFQENKLEALIREVGKKHLILDLSFRKHNDSWIVATNRWQTLSQLHLNQKNIQSLQNSCDEFLIHAADVEGLQKGIDEKVIQTIAPWLEIPATYAGGAQSIKDLQKVKNLSDDKIDLTIGSALDIFGGTGAIYSECIAWNQRNKIG